MSSTDGPVAYQAKLDAIQQADAARFEAFNQANQERREIIKDILNKYMNLLEEHENLQIDFEHLQRTNRNIHKERQIKERELADIKLEQDSNPMVGVFIDGDGAKFQEELIRDGVEGGERAAHALRTSIKKQLKESYPDLNTDNWQIMVWCIAAIDGLANAYEVNMSNKDGFTGVNFTLALRRFAIGFNRGAHYTFNFIDVGGGKGLKLKEITDAKLRDTFTMMLPHCKHVFFAGCHDEGYVSFLSPYKLEPNVAPKITLIETYNTMPKYYDLGFKMAKFPQIFRQQDFPPPGPVPPNPQLPLQTKSCNISAIPRPSPPPSVTDSRSTTPAFTGPGSSWAAIGKNGLSQNKTIDITTSKRTAKRYYLVNKDGERIDEHLRMPPRELFERFNARIDNENNGLKFCNTCNFEGPDKCNKLGDFKHGTANLPLPELQVYRYVVRTGKCEPWCDNVNCPYSHHCKFGPNCEKKWDCKFVTTHHTDRTPYRKIYEDGSSQLV